MYKNSLIGLLMTAAVSLALVGPSSPAAAVEKTPAAAAALEVTRGHAKTSVGPSSQAAPADQTPSAVDALEVIPGLADAAVSNSSAELTASSLGVTVEGTSGKSTTIERVSAVDAEVTQSEEGQTVLEGTSVDTDTIVQQLSDGARVLEVIGSAAAPQDFVYDLDMPSGMKLLPQEDGSLLIGAESRVADTVNFEVDGVIGAPWAIDANGVAVPASYDVSDAGLVTMHVERSPEVAYPVVADPTFTKGGFKVVYNILTPWSVTVYLNRARTSDAEDGGAVVCIGIAFVPVVGPVVAALCGLQNVMIRAASRYGYCQYWVANTVSRSFSVNLYRSGFCA